jgi:hypothetical protein
MIVSGYFYASAVHIDIAPASIVQDLHNQNLVHRGQFFQMHMLEIALGSPTATGLVSQQLYRFLLTNAIKFPRSSQATALFVFNSS